jgi:hypothetical protein
MPIELADAYRISVALSPGGRQRGIRIVVAVCDGGGHPVRRSAQSARRRHSPGP